MSDRIRLRGVRTHNLKNIDIDLPRHQLIVFTGLSGSGKSSLAFDTIYAEGQRRYVESLSAYARQFLSMMEKPELDSIEGLSPAIAIEQKSASHNPRSTVGTITEIYDYLRLLYARVGQARCPKHHHELSAQTISQMVDHVLALPEGTAVMVLAPVVRERKGEFVQLLDQLKGQGFIRARVDGKLIELDQVPALNLRQKHTIEVVVDRIKVRSDVKQRLAESFETAVRLADGLAAIAPMVAHEIEEQVFSAKLACPDCGYSLQELEPRLFSFNNPAGACPTCDGLGVQQEFDPDKIVHDRRASLAEGAIRGWDRRNVYYYHLLSSLAKHYRFDMDTPFERLSKTVKQVLLYGSDDTEIKFTYVNQEGKKTQRTHTFEGVIPIMERRYRDTESSAVYEELGKYLTIKECKSCMGTRLREEARNVFIANKNLPEITALSISDAKDFFNAVKLTGKRKEIADKILKEVRSRLGFLVEVGLNYLTLARRAETLSGGEAQRIRLASQIGSGLTGVMYVLDEPSIGLHQRDNKRLLNTLTHLRDLGNTVIVVEHDEDAIRLADYVLDIGPGAGIHGGSVVAAGTPEEIMRNKASLTGQYLSGEKQIPIPTQRVQNTCRQSIKLKGVTCNNLKNIDVDIPIGLMTCITGVSGSGKSSLISDTLYPLVAMELNGATQRPIGNYEEISGLEYLDKVIEIDQAPIGRTPRSNPATYTGLLTPIRELFAGTPEARARGYRSGRFSFNVPGGRCEACEGDGVTKVEMHFLADIYVMCDVCQGKRYNRETLEIHYKGKNIHDILKMTIEDALQFFKAVPVIAKKLQTLMDVGLSYLTLGQSATTLSGGEAQRIKLSRELSKRATGKTLYLLDEPTTGLHFHDILQLLQVLYRLRQDGNTIVIIEHNLDVIKVADWIIDLGPDGGAGGGEIVVAGTPETVAKSPRSHTGQFLKDVLKQK